MADGSELTQQALSEAKAEARALARQIGRFLTAYGPIGADVVSWRENQDISQGEDALKAFGAR